jgi:hypothetical protein
MNCGPREQKDEKHIPSPVTFLNPLQHQKRPVTQLPPLPFSQEYIYKQLVAKGLLSPVPARPWNPPYPAWYDPNVKCAFHNNVAGHSTENCNRLRQEIYELINAGIVELNSGEQEYLETNDQLGINEAASGENGECESIKGTWAGPSPQSDRVPEFDNIS